MTLIDQLDDHAGDAVARALRADAERWRDSHAAPSLDDAVRRLVAAERRPARHRSTWWRPVGVAAAVLLLIGGAVGIAVRPNPARMPTRPSPAVPLKGAGAPSAPTLTGLPPGFVEVSGDVPSPADAAQGPGPGSRRPVVLRSWVGARTISVSPTASPMQESFILSSIEGVVPVRRTHTVHGSPAEVDEEEWPPSDTDHATIISVLWASQGDTVRLVYTGPATSAGSGRPLSVRQVLDVAGSYRAVASDVPGPGARPVPATLTSGSTTLVVAGLGQVRARPGTDDRHLLVTLPGATAQSPGLASGCEPYATALLTGASPSSVTIAVVRYAPQTSGPTGVCFQARGRVDREVTVDLGAARGGRLVIDASTGSSVPVPAR